MFLQCTRWSLCISLVSGGVAAFVPGCGSSDAKDSSSPGGFLAMGGAETTGGAGDVVATAGTRSSGGAGATGGSATSTTEIAAAGRTNSGGALTTGGSSVKATTGGDGSVCTSKSTWRSGEGPTMRPGEPCISCHSSSADAPKFSIAGTVYPTLHEPADCNGTNVSGSAKIIITDAQGVEHSVSVNSVGNFMLEGLAISLPYHARVEASTGTRSMAASQSSGDCNGCHSEKGANGAPGRIMLP